VEVGETVEVGAIITTIEAGSGAAKSKAKTAAAPKPVTVSSDETTSSITLSPAVRRLVLEHGVDPRARMAG